jgi:hypothetical protein
MAKTTLTSRAAALGGISIELGDAPPGKDARSRVMGWLRLHRPDIESAAKRFNVAPEAIAGAISYEALVDVEPLYFLGFARFTGPGKVHYKEDRIGEGDPVAKQVETLGYLPRRTVETRKLLLSTARWSTLYIAAIMRAFVDASHSRTLACQPDLLVALYVRDDIPGSRTIMLNPHRILTSSRAALWVRDNVNFLRQSLMMRSRQKARTRNSDRLERATACAA